MRTTDTLESPFADKEALAGACGDPAAPATAALAAASPFQQAFEDQSPSFGSDETGVIGGDNRVRVTPTTGVPWRWICRINVKGNRDAQPAGGTGFLVSNRHVLTAAHVVHEAAQNMQNFSIEVIPALDYGDEPFGSYAVTSRPRIPAAYHPDADDRLDHDYALLELDTAIGSKTFGKLQGQALGFWGDPVAGAKSVLARPDPATLNLKAVLTAGYPASAGGRKLMCAAGQLFNVKRLQRTMRITADMTPGQSGSPVWAQDHGVCSLVGIAVGASTNANYAVRLTREVIRQLRDWIRAGGEQPAMVDQEDAGETESLAPPEAGGESEEEAQDHEVPGWAAAIDLFPATPGAAFAAGDPAMDKAFEPIGVSTVSHLCGAVVDLTGNPATPAYAGINDQEMLFVGSLPKICAMYAAFALRAQVQAFVDAAAAHGAAVQAPAIVRTIESAWRPRLKALFPDRPTSAFGIRGDTVFPKLEQIFTFSPDGKVDFVRESPAFSDADLDAPARGGVSAEFKAPPGRFHDWMRLMLRWSNNTAASRCILAIGYFYLNGALARAGLFDAGTSKGLWLSADYAGHDWVGTEAGRQNNAAGPPLAARWAGPQRRRRSNSTATAAQIARFMTLLAQDQLMDAAACAEMRRLITITPGGIGSYARAALRRVGRTPTRIAAKIGYGDDSFSHDCAIVERTVAGKALRYVAVGLGSAPARQREDLRDLFVLLDDTIVTRNS